jgi:type I restriction enzyme R subunit
LKIGHQSEAVLENNLIKQLRDLSYASVKIQDCEALVANLQSQFSLFNETTITAKEFDAILNFSQRQCVRKDKTLRDRFQLTKEDGTSFYVCFSIQRQQ